MDFSCAKVSKKDFEFSENTRRIRAANAKIGEWYVFRREFSLEDISEVTLALLPSYYAEVYINGKLVSRFCERTYIFDMSFKAIDITGFVHKGINSVAVLNMCYFAGEVMRDNFALQINAGGVPVLESDIAFKVKKFTPISDGANFYIEGPQICEKYDARLDSICGAFDTGFDDGDFENAECVGEALEEAPYYSIHQDKNEMQTELPVYADSFISFEKSRDKKGIFIKIPPSAGKALLCETNIIADKDTGFIVYNLGGMNEMHIDGKKINFGESIGISKGSHRMAVYGGAPSMFVCADGISFSAPHKDGEWLKYEIEVKTETPRFPWNGYKKPYKIPEKVSEYLSALTFDSLPEEIKKESDIVAVSHSSTETERLSFKDYIKCVDSITDKEADSRFPREISNFVLGVSGKENLFSEKGDMTVSISENDTTFILDFGVEHVGGVYFDITAPEGAEITINAFEAIEYGVPRLGSAHNTLFYICKEGRNVYLSHIRRGFRYMLVNVSSSRGDIIFHEIGLSEWRFPAEDKAHFECSDALLNRIYKMSVDTAKVCMLDAYVDCPGYEQNIWVGDARVTATVNLTDFGETEYNARYLRLISESISDYLTKIYRPKNPRYIARRFLPCATFPTYPEGNIPIWSYQWLLAVLDHYKYTADKNTLLDVLPAVEETFNRSEILSSERGLLSIDGAWNLIEWAYNDVSEYGEVTSNNMMLSYCYKKFSEIEAELGKTELAKLYSERAERIKDTINKYCWNEEKHAYVDTLRDEISYKKYLEYYASIGKTPLSFEDYMALSRISVQTNTFAVLYGIAEGERKRYALSLIEKCISDGIYIAGTPARRSIGEPSADEAPDGIVRVGSPFFMFFVLEALFENGLSDVALNAMRDGWGKMLDFGITTCTEGFNGENEWRTRSVAHAWSASPAIYLVSEVLGIKPMAPGYTEFSIEPKISSLEYAKGSVPTPYGKIYVEWKKNADGAPDIICRAPKECKRIK
ncbi:MAG: family 78 glycoside hydrolase catalytic domain [Eubacteriales bacterium]